MTSIEKYILTALFYGPKTYSQIREGCTPYLEPLLGISELDDTLKQMEQSGRVVVLDFCSPARPHMVSHLYFHGDTEFLSSIYMSNE